MDNHGCTCYSSGHDPDCMKHKLQRQAATGLPTLAEARAKKDAAKKALTLARRRGQSTYKLQETYEYWLTKVLMAWQRENA